MRKLLNSILLLLCIIVTIACNDLNKMSFHQYHTIDGEWERKDTLRFDVPPTDSMQTVQLFAEVRNARNYAFADLYLVVRQNLADSLKWQTDTIHIQLADSLGRWTGLGGANYFQSSQYVRSIRLPLHPFHATIFVSQGLKDEKLKGITNVGVRIERVQYSQ